MDIAVLARLYEEADAPCRYQRVSRALESAIQQGLCLPGEALPTQRALADALGLTLGTVTHGYAEAAKAGLLNSVVGRGTFVASNRPDVDVLPRLRCWMEPFLNIPRFRGEMQYGLTLYQRAGI